MPKMLKIGDMPSSDTSFLFPLRVTHKRSHWSGKRSCTTERVRVKCGCCKEAVEIYPTVECRKGHANIDTLEINGVFGTVAQWRQVLLPMPGVAIPESLEMVYEDTAVLDPFSDLAPAAKETGDASRDEDHERAESQ